MPGPATHKKIKLDKAPTINSTYVRDYPPNQVNFSNTHDVVDGKIAFLFFNLKTYRNWKSVG